MTTQTSFDPEFKDAIVASLQSLVNDKPIGDVNVQLMALSQAGLSNRALVVIQPTAELSSADILATLSASFTAMGFESQPGYFLVSDANETAEMAATKARSKRGSKKDDSEPDMPKLKVMHDGAAFKIIHKLYEQYVGADTDFRHVMSFMKDVDDLLAGYRKSLGNSKVRPLTESRVDDGQEPAEGNRVDRARVVKKATKEMIAGAPRHEEVASVDPEDQDIAAPEVASAAPEVPLVLAPVVEEKTASE